MTEKCNDCLSGVTCEVVECHYHQIGDKCSASGISVSCCGDGDACTSEGTECRTFIPKS